MCQFFSANSDGKGGSVKITKKLIKKYKPCQEALNWWDGEADSIKVLKKLIKNTRKICLLEAKI